MGQSTACKQAIRYQKYCRQQEIPESCQAISIIKDICTKENFLVDSDERIKDDAKIADSFQEYFANIAIEIVINDNQAFLSDKSGIRGLINITL